MNTSDVVKDLGRFIIVHEDFFLYIVIDSIRLKRREDDPVGKIKKEAKGHGPLMSSFIYFIKFIIE